MKFKIIFIALTIISVPKIFGQKRLVENAFKDAQLVAAKDATPIEDEKACAIINKSANRTISVRIEESTMTNNFLRKRIIAFEKIAPGQRKFVGYAGCEANVLAEKCRGYKIIAAYYEDGQPVIAPKESAPDALAHVPVANTDKAITAK